MPRSKLHQLLAPFAVLAAVVALAACSSNQPPDDNGGIQVLVTSPLSDVQVAAVGHSPDPVVQQLLAAGYQAQNQIEPGGTMDRWLLELICDADPASQCSKAPFEVRLPLTGPVTATAVSIDAKGPVYVTGNEPKPRLYDCQTKYPGFKTATLWKLPAKATAKGDGQHKLKIDGVTYTCTVKTIKRNAAGIPRYGVPAINP